MDFDQIIKQKVEQKEYPYSASSWHRFAKKAGLKSTLTASQSVIIAIVSVAIISVGSWLGFRYLVPSHEVAPTTEISVEETPAPELTAADTVVSETPEENVTVTELSTPSRKPVQPVVTNEEPKAMVTDTVSEPKPVKKPILRPKNPRRILEIDPDTIKSNE